MKTKEIVEKYFENVNEGKWDEYLNLFDENVVMDEQLMGHLEGIEEVRKGIEGLKNAPKFENHPLEIVVEGDRAMAIWQINAIPAPGINIEARGVNYYKIENGKIKQFSNYHDTKPFAPVLQNQ